MANPAPPVGPVGSARGQHHGVLQGLQCQNPTSRRGDHPGCNQHLLGSVFYLYYKDPPASDLLKKAAGIIKGSAVPNKDKVGKVTSIQVEEIARLKMPDLNAVDLKGAVRIIEGTARSMGIQIVS